MIRAFSNNPPPRAVSGVTGLKLLKNPFKNRSKCMDFNFVPAGGGGGGKKGETKANPYLKMGMDDHSQISWRKVEGKGRVSNPFGEDCVEIRLKKLDLS